LIVTNYEANTVFVRLLILFIVVPIVELAVLLKLHDMMGLSSTILLVLCTGFLGAWLARQQGFSALNKIQQTLNARKAPGIEIVEGVLVLLAGAVLITPGLLTDLIGFSLLIPPVRRRVAEYLVQRFRTKTNSSFQVFTTGIGSGQPLGPGPSQSDPNVIDVDFERVQPDQPDQPPHSAF
jgi:UPF0716 protein FxsA